MLDALQALRRPSSLFSCYRRPQDQKSERASIPEAFSLLLRVPVSEARYGPLGKLYVLSHPILFRFRAAFLALGRSPVPEASSKYWGRSLDKQGGTHFCTGGPSSLFGAFQFQRYPIQSRIRGAFYALKRSLIF